MATTKTKQTFELSNQDVQRAIAEYLERQYGRQGEITVDVRVATVTTGYGMQESDSHVVKITASREV